MGGADEDDEFYTKIYVKKGKLSVGKRSSSYLEWYSLKDSVNVNIEMNIPAERVPYVIARSVGEPYSIRINYKGGGFQEIEMRKSSRIKKLKCENFADLKNVEINDNKGNKTVVKFTIYQYIYFGIDQ